MGLFKTCQCGKRILFLNKMCAECFIESHEVHRFVTETHYDTLPPEVGGYSVSVDNKLMFVINREADKEQARSVYNSLYSTMIANRGKSSHIHVWSAPLQR